MSAPLSVRWLIMFGPRVLYLTWRLPDTAYVSNSLTHPYQKGRMCYCEQQKTSKEFQSVWVDFDVHIISSQTGGMRVTDAERIKAANHSNLITQLWLFLHKIIGASIYRRKHNKLFAWNQFYKNIGASIWSNKPRTLTIIIKIAFFTFIHIFCGSP